MLFMSSFDDDHFLPPKVVIFGVNWGVRISPPMTRWPSKRHRFEGLRVLFQMVAVEKRVCLKSEVQKCNWKKWMSTSSIDDTKKRMAKMDFEWQHKQCFQQKRVGQMNTAKQTVASEVETKWVKTGNVWWLIKWVEVETDRRIEKQILCAHSLQKLSN